MQETEPMNKARITVAGLGPGSAEDMTPAVRGALAQADVVVGYKYYFRFIADSLAPHTRTVDTGMKRERERAETALRLAAGGQRVCVVSSGDAGIYGMAPLIYEMARKEHIDVDIEVLPGISAFQKAASLLGAPVGHDLCILSLSDLMTPWSLIERRIRAAVDGDFVTAVYNPRSNDRYWQLPRLRELFLAGRDAATPVGYVRQAGRPEQQVTVTTLAEFDPAEVDMFTVVLIGNSQSYIDGGRIITPRGYYREEETDAAVGQQIMINSFRTIAAELHEKEIPLDRKWVLLHAIHTTADFEMERLLWMNDGAAGRLHGRFVAGSVRTVVTDVTMAAAGIRRGALERLGIEVKCYLHDPRVAEIAKNEGITRTQAGIRLAAEEHPEALFVFGNAPTALMELCRLVRRGKARPTGIVAAPVGFVHVEESKQMVKPLAGVERIIVEGRKGGSNLAATIVNALLTLDDAGALRPGRDV